MRKAVTVYQMIRKLSEAGLINDETSISIFEGRGILGTGKWYQDGILVYGTRPVKSFTWEEGNRLTVAVHEKEEN